jgi:hypothetical protein
LPERLLCDAKPGVQCEFKLGTLRSVKHANSAATLPPSGLQHLRFIQRGHGEAFHRTD